MSEISSEPQKKHANTDSERTSKQNFLRIVIPYLVIILAQLPLVFLYFKNLWQTRPHYEACLFGIIAFVVFVYLWWPKQLKRPFFRSWFSVALLAVGLFFALLATVFVTPWFAYFSTLCLVGSLLARTRNEETGRSLLPLVLLLLVFLQPPSGIDFETVYGDYWVVIELQTISSNVSSYFLDILGYKHNLEGVIIQMPNSNAENGVKSYSVEQACSGVQSFFTLLFITAVLIIVLKRPWFRATLLLLSAMFWAVIMNTIRILVIPIADAAFNLDLAVGFSHMMWGYLALIIGVLLVVSTDQLLVFMFGPVDLDGMEEESSFRKQFSRFWNSVFSGASEQERTSTKKREISSAFRKSLLPIAGCMALVFIVQSIDVVTLIGKKGVSVFDYDPTMSIKDSNVPEEIGSAENRWTKVEYRFENRVGSSDLGQRSDQWVFSTRKPNQHIIASIDQTFPGWHELTKCYELGAWKRLSRERFDLETESGESWPYIQAEFENATGKRGFLLFSLFDRVGEPYEAPGSWGNLNSVFIQIRNRLSHRLRARLFHGEGYQVQIFIQSTGELSLDDQENITDNYLLFRNHLRGQFVDGTIKLASESGGQTEDQSENPNALNTYNDEN